MTAQGGSPGAAKTKTSTKAAKAASQDQRAARLAEVVTRLADIDRERLALQPERDEIVVELVAAGLTYAQIGSLAGMTDGNVFHIVDKHRRAAKAAAKARKPVTPIPKATAKK